jgi:membrane protease YdiL (CAAX protease family)
VAALVSLVALGWPVLRGVPWRQVREDLGLNFGRRPSAEPACGLACYLMSLPIVGVGLLATMLLQWLFLERTDAFAPLGGPSHPIAIDIARGDFWVRLEVLVLACIMAPLLEEIMFRGLLYRNLRELTGRMGRGWSFLLSATGVSFIFAAIHPQGLLAVPMLMALAYGFALAREWRGTLLPAMVAHGVNNGIVTVFAMLALGD